MTDAIDALTQPRPLAPPSCSTPCSVTNATAEMWRHVPGLYSRCWASPSSSPAAPPPSPSPYALGQPLTYTGPSVTYPNGDVAGHGRRCYVKTAYVLRRDGGDGLRVLFPKNKKTTLLRLSEVQPASTPALPPSAPKPRLLLSHRVLDTFAEMRRHRTGFNAFRDCRARRRTYHRLPLRWPLLIGFSALRACLFRHRVTSRLARRWSLRAGLSAFRICLAHYRQLLSVCRRYPLVWRHAARHGLLPDVLPDAYVSEGEPSHWLPPIPGMRPPLRRGPFEDHFPGAYSGIHATRAVDYIPNLQSGDRLMPHPVVALMRGCWNNEYCYNRSLNVLETPLRRNIYTFWERFTSFCKGGMLWGGAPGGGSENSKIWISRITRMQRCIMSDAGLIPQR